ncbi:MAG: GNAT family N-acetyltransferase [Erythrobacter sp.]
MIGERNIVDGAGALTGALIGTLSLAFQDDPALAWIIPDPDERRARLPHLFTWLVDDHTRRGMVLASPCREAVSLWYVPGAIHHQPPLTPMLAWRMWRIFGANVLRADRTGRHIAAHVPEGENWLYLHFIGVHPEAQGKGWGGAAIRAGIAEGNRRGVDICLETATPENVGIYQRLGFGIVEEWDVPGGPRFWTMVRPRD